MAKREHRVYVGDDVLAHFVVDDDRGRVPFPLYLDGFRRQTANVVDGEKTAQTRMYFLIGHRGKIIFLRQTFERTRY